VRADLLRFGSLRPCGPGLTNSQEHDQCVSDCDRRLLVRATDHTLTLVRV